MFIFLRIFLYGHVYVCMDMCMYDICMDMFMYDMCMYMLLIEWSVTVTVTVHKPEPFRLSKASNYDHSGVLLGDCFFFIVSKNQDIEYLVIEIHTANTARRFMYIYIL
jgi:hypothetical protein